MIRNNECIEEMHSIAHPFISLREGIDAYISGAYYTEIKLLLGLVRREKLSGNLIQLPGRTFPRSHLTLSPP